MKLMRKYLRSLFSAMLILKKQRKEQTLEKQRSWSLKKLVQCDADLEKAEERADTGETKI